MDRTGGFGPSNVGSNPTRPIINYQFFKRKKYKGFFILIIMEIGLIIMCGLFIILIAYLIFHRLRLQLSLFIIAFLVFLLVGSLFTIQQGGINLGEKEGQTNFIKAFGDWLLGLGKNVVYVTGYIMKLPWLPNQTNVTNSSR